MSLAPFLPTPFTDMSWFLAPGFKFAPPNSLCSKIQLKYMDCLEAYGLHKGRDKCAELFYDTCECGRYTFQHKRAEAIRAERMRQYRAGKLDKPFDEHPPLDSYIYLQ